MVAQVFSSGGGTQSACIAAMICQGELEKPDFAAIVDTHYEASSTWKYHYEVVYPALKSVGVELVRIPSKQYATVGLWGGRHGDTLLIPAFTTQTGTVGKMPTLCSNEWKVRVLHRWLRDQGVKEALIWLGYSTDEMHRTRHYIDGPWKNRWPLIEKGLRRNDSIQFVKRMGWPDPPRSACWMCPNMTFTERAQQKQEQPEDFAKAVEFERAIRERDEDVWLSEKAQPLDEVDFTDDQFDMFESRCPNTGCFT